MVIVTHIQLLDYCKKFLPTWLFLHNVIMRKQITPLDFKLACQLSLIWLQWLCACASKLCYNIIYYRTKDSHFLSVLSKNNQTLKKGVWLLLNGYLSKFVCLVPNVHFVLLSWLTVCGSAKAQFHVKINFWQYRLTRVFGPSLALKLCMEGMYRYSTGGMITATNNFKIS